MLDQDLAAARVAPAQSATPWWRVPFGFMSPAGRRGRLTVLIFHRVHAQPDPLFPTEMTAAAFRERMEWAREWFNVLPLDAAAAALAAGTLPARAAAITFDDGYADNAGLALPILLDLGLPATFFIATGFLDGGRMWNDTVIEAIRGARGPTLDLSSIGLGRHALGSDALRRAAIDALLPALKHLHPDLRQTRVDAVAAIADFAARPDLMMSSADVRRLAAAGMGVGAHTVRHPILAALSDDEARDEIAESREMLAGLLHQPITLFAYPNGKPDRDYRSRDVKTVRDLGFAAAFSTARGAARRGDSAHEIPRFTPWGRTPARWGSRLARNYLAAVERAA